MIGQKSLSKQEQKTAIPWPKALPEQIQALANALTAQPQTTAQLAAHFKGRSLAKALLPLLETLAVLGRAHMSVAQLLQLGQGSILELDRKVGEAIDIYVNNRLVARGEVVVVDERLGVTMTEIIKDGDQG